MNATTSAMKAVLDAYSPEVSERVRWSSALWIVMERDGPLTWVERVGTVPVFAPAGMD